MVRARKYDCVTKDKVHCSKYHKFGTRQHLWFAIMVNIVHAGIMMFQALGDKNEHAHLIGDVPLLFVASIILWYLMPPKGQRSE